MSRVVQHTCSQPRRIRTVWANLLYDLVWKAILRELRGFTFPSTPNVRDVRDPTCTRRDETATSRRTRQRPANVRERPTCSNDFCGPQTGVQGPS
eukprot:10483514-Alexandrium_andersonii.AAC.1